MFFLAGWIEGVADEVCGFQGVYEMADEDCFGKGIEVDNNFSFNDGNFEIFSIWCGEGGVPFDNGVEAWVIFWVVDVGDFFCY